MLLIVARVVFRLLLWCFSLVCSDLSGLIYCGLRELDAMLLVWSSSWWVRLCLSRLSVSSVQCSVLLM